MLLKKGGGRKLNMRLMVALTIALAHHNMHAMGNILQPSQNSAVRLTPVKDGQGRIVGYYNYSDNNNQLDWQPVMNVYNKKSEFITAIPLMDNTEESAKKQLRKARTSELLIKYLLPIVTKRFVSSNSE